MERDRSLELIVQNVAAGGHLDAPDAKGSGARTGVDSAIVVLLVEVER